MADYNIRQFKNLEAGTVEATSVVSALTGNSSTATALQSARTITLAGDITGSTSFDGSTNVTITTDIAAEPAWSTLPSLNTTSWEEYTTGDRQGARYYKDYLGRVWFKGHIYRKNTNSGWQTIFTLPSGFRPNSSRDFVCASSGGISKITISSSGVVTLSDVESGFVSIYLSLDQVYFRADGS